MTGVSYRMFFELKNVWFGMGTNFDEVLLWPFTTSISQEDQKVSAECTKFDFGIVVQAPPAQISTIAKQSCSYGRLLLH